MRSDKAIKAVLDGRSPLSSLTDSQRSMMSLAISHKAADILRLPKTERLRYIEREPEDIQDWLKQEVMRIHKYRQENNR